MSTVTQQDLPMFKFSREDANVGWFLGLLKERGWMTRKDVLRVLGWPVTEDNLRWVRALASAGGGSVVKGQKGFNDVSNCTPEEINHCANQEEAQGKLMIEYSIALRRAGCAALAGHSMTGNAK